MSDTPTLPRGGMLNRKVFGVPVLYLAAGFVAILAVLAWRMKSVPDSEAATDDGTPVVAPDIDSEIYPDMPNGTVIVAPQPAPVSDNANSGIDNNDEWLKRGVAFLIQSGYGPGDAQIALQAYLEGSALSSAQGEMRDKAIRELGLPPYPPLAGGTAPAPSRSQGPLPRAHVVKSLSEDSVSELATLYYGRSDTFTTGAIMKHASNAGLNGKSTGWEIGTSVYIPVLPTPAAVPVTPPFPGILKRGMRSASVRLMQQRLNHFGLGTPVNGLFGLENERDVKVFQKRRRLRITGVVDRLTWEQLWKG